jgi:hypothetical protein
MDNKNYCKICDENFSSVSTYNRHLKSKGHLKKLWKKEQDNPDREEKFNLTEKEFLKVESGEKYKLEKKENIYVCEYCDYETNDSGNFTRHKLTEKHILNEAKVKAGLIRQKNAENLEELEKIKVQLDKDIENNIKKKIALKKFIKDNQENPDILLNVYEKKLETKESQIKYFQTELGKIENKILTFTDNKLGEIITVQGQKKKIETGATGKKLLIEKIKRDELYLNDEEEVLKDNITNYKKIKKSLQKKGIVIDKETLKKAMKFLSDIEVINTELGDVEETNQQGEVITLNESLKEKENDKKYLKEKLNNLDLDIKDLNSERPIIFKDLSKKEITETKKEKQKESNIIYKKIIGLEKNIEKLRDKISNKGVLTAQDILDNKNLITENEDELEKIRVKYNIDEDDFKNYLEVLNNIESSLQDIEDFKKSLKENNEKYKKLFES